MTLRFVATTILIVNIFTRYHSKNLCVYTLSWILSTKTVVRQPPSLRVELKLEFVELKYSKQIVFSYNADEVCEGYAMHIFVYFRQ